MCLKTEWDDKLHLISIIRMRFFTYGAARKPQFVGAGCYTTLFSDKCLRFPVAVRVWDYSNLVALCFPLISNMNGPHVNLGQCHGLSLRALSHVAHVSCSRELKRLSAKWEK